MSGAGTASQTFTVKVQCNPDANGKITFPTLAYWSNNKDANTCNPYPATKSKCTKGTTTVNVAAIKGKITVKKIAVAVGTFDFAVTGGATQNFSLATGDTRDIEVDAIKTPVDYIITETVPDGWQFSRATCTSSAGGTWSNALGSSAVTVPVSFAHTDISCEFINAKNPPAGTVKLVKSLTTGDLGQFTYKLGDQATEASGGSGEKASGSFTAGDTVSFSEVAATGTSLGNYNIGWRCVGSDNQQLIGEGLGSNGSITMPQGGAVCTIANQRKMHPLTVKKALSPTTDSGKFNLLINGSGASNVGHEGEYSVDVPVGSAVTVSETAGANTLLANYSSQLVCEGVGGVSDTSPTFVMPDSKVTCIFTNTRLSAKLKVAKAWASGFKAGDKATVTTTGFTHNANSGESTADIGTTGTEVVVYAGETGQLTETFSVGNMTDYTQGYACSGGGTVDTEGNVSIGAADKDKTITCTLTNTRKSSAIRIIKTSSAGEGKLVPGGTVTYTVVVSNTGQIGLIDVPVNDPMPAGIESQTWSCIGASGASCNPASGSGGIAGTVNLPAGSSVTYTVTAQVSDSLNAAVTNTATVTPPSGTACANEPPSTTESCSASVTNEPGPRPPAPGTVAPIPTTSPEGLAALALMMVGVAGWAVRRQRRGRK